MIQAAIENAGKMEKLSVCVRVCEENSSVFVKMSEEMYLKM